MSIECKAEYGGMYGNMVFVPVCDVCGAELPVEYDFMDAVRATEEAGWKSRIVDNEWRDICVDCQEDER